MLVLLDIDGTLLSSEGAGAMGMEHAGVELFGASFSLQDIDLGGRLDPLIFREAMAAIGRDDHDDHHDTFRTVYHGKLKALLSTDHQVRTLPGVSELLAQLASLDGVTLALVTGNYRETAVLKLQAAGIDPGMFVLGAYGDEGAHRHDLPPLAIDRFRDLCARDPVDIVLLGDTEHDVTSGRAAGCRVLAVCTGSHERTRLHDSGADLVLEDLSDVEAVLHWILDDGNNE